MWCWQLLSKSNLHIWTLWTFRYVCKGKFSELNWFKFVLFCNRGDIILYHGGLRSRELCQAPMLLVFLTPRQALSSHPRQCFCASLKLLFFMIFVGVHEFSSRLTTFSSCRCRGSNRWPLGYRSNAPPVHHGGLPTDITYTSYLWFTYILWVLSVNKNFIYHPQLFLTVLKCPIIAGAI